MRVGAGGREDLGGGEGMIGELEYCLTERSLSGRSHNAMNWHGNSHCSLTFRELSSLWQARTAPCVDVQRNCASSLAAAISSSVNCTEMTTSWTVMVLFMSH